MYRTKNKYQFKGDTVEVYTRKGQAFWIDAKDAEKVLRYTWCLSKTGYLVANIGNKVTKIHRYLLGCKQGEVVDHIDGNPLNNIRKNLRICTQKQNMQNNKLSKNNTSGYPGVGLIKKTGKFRARIMVDRKEILLGYYSALEEAVEARKRAERKYYKEFAPCDGALKHL